MSIRVLSERASLLWSEQVRQADEAYEAAQARKAHQLRQASETPPQDYNRIPLHHDHDYDLSSEMGDRNQYNELNSVGFSKH
jgi:hypothetical protein